MNNVEKALKLIEDSLNKKCNGLECKVVKNNIDLRLENSKLKKQIDLMARAFKQDDVRSVEEIKQYFKELAERKSENGN